MPYAGISELPPAVKDNLPKPAQRIFLEVANASLKAGDDESKAFKKAWSAVENAGFEKNADGKWVKKASFAAKYQSINTCPEGVANLTPEAQTTWMQIACACIEAGDGEMFAEQRAWHAVKENWKQNADGQWMKKAPASMFSLEDPTHEVKGVEIFATGTWKGEKYDEVDLDKMVKQFNAGITKVPLKIGHDSSQKVAGQPAVGLLQRVYRVGKKLMADIGNVPKLVAELINKKAYHSVSSEIAFDADFGGMIYDKLLVGVSLLGSEIPALNNLADIPKVYSARLIRVETFAVEAGEIKVEGKINDKEEFEMNEELKKKMDDAERKIVELSGTIEVEKKRADAAEAKIVADKQAEDKKAIDEFAAKLVTEGKILPAIKDRVVKSLIGANNSKKVEFALGDKTIQETERQNLMSVYEAMPKVELYGQVGHGGDGAGKSADDRINELSEQRAKEKSISFSAALKEVMTEHPELRKSTPIVGMATQK